MSTVRTHQQIKELLYQASHHIEEAKRLADKASTKSDDAGTITSKIGIRILKYGLTEAEKSVIIALGAID
jgi:hypothetical protein